MIKRSAKPIKPGRKMKADAKNTAKLRKMFNAAGINYCERCSSRGILTFAHRMTRQFIKTDEERQTVARICLHCHIEIEGRPDMKQIIDSIIATREERYYQAA